VIGLLHCQLISHRRAQLLVLTTLHCWILLIVFILKYPSTLSHGPQWEFTYIGIVLWESTELNLLPLIYKSSPRIMFQMKSHPLFHWVFHMFSWEKGNSWYQLATPATSGCFWQHKSPAGCLQSRTFIMTSSYLLIGGIVKIFFGNTSPEQKTIQSKYPQCDAIKQLCVLNV